VPVPRPAPRPALELWLTGAGLLVTALACALFGRAILARTGDELADGDWAGLASLFLFIGVVAFLVYGNLVYQITRLGYFSRLRRRRSPPLDDLITSIDGRGPAVVVLVPSYKEELRTIRQTLLSAALQFYSNRRVV
jgi:cellulose synthase (UDP-forming)